MDKLMEGLEAICTVLWILGLGFALLHAREALELMADMIEWLCCWWKRKKR